MYSLLFLSVLVSLLIISKLDQANKKEFHGIGLPFKQSTPKERIKEQKPSFSKYEPNTKNLSTTEEHPCRGEWSPSKNKYYSDRIDNGKKLYLGQFICSTRSGIYKFGLDYNGDLVWIDTSEEDEAKQKIVLFKNDEDISGVNPEDYYFVLRKDGRFMIYHDDEEIWTRECERDVSYTVVCLKAHSIEYSCPYLHIHEGGKVVLNYIDDDWNWIDRDIMRVYGFDDD